MQKTGLSVNLKVNLFDHSRPPKWLQEHQAGHLLQSLVNREELYQEGPVQITVPAAAQ